MSTSTPYVVPTWGFDRMTLRLRLSWQRQTQMERRGIGARGYPLTEFEMRQQWTTRVAYLAEDSEYVLRLCRSCECCQASMASARKTPVRRLLPAQMDGPSANNLTCEAVPGATRDRGPSKLSTAGAHVPKGYEPKKMVEESKPRVATGSYSESDRRANLTCQNPSCYVLAVIRG